MKILKTKKRTYVVEQNADGSLTITLNGVDRIPNVGLFIYNMGGVDALLARCKDGDYTFEGITKYINEQDRLKEEARQRARKEAKQKEAKRVAEFETLVSQYEGEAIPTTYENIGIVLRYLNIKIWGSWDLPKMTIGYSCYQYDCGGKIASTMILDEPIDIREEEEKAEEGSRPILVSKFQVGAPSGYLTKYLLCR